MGSGIAAALFIVSSLVLSVRPLNPIIAPQLSVLQLQEHTDSPAPAVQAADVVPNSFPRPRNPFGLHDTPIVGGSRDLNRAISDWEALDVSWVTVLDPREELLRRAGAAGIMVVGRVYSPSVFEQGDIRGVTDRMVRDGMVYVIPFNEPNLKGECAGRAPDPVDFAQRWIAAAEIIHARGGYPVLTPLAPEGDYPDVQYLRKLLSQIVAIKDAQWLVDYHVVIGVHSYILRPTDSYLSRFQTYDAIVREVTGHSLPLLGTEGGVVRDNLHPANTPQVVTDKTLEIVDQLIRPDWPSNILGGSLWLYSNKAQGGKDEKFEQDAWYQLRGPQPIYNQVRLKYGPQLDPLASSGLLLNMTP